MQQSTDHSYDVNIQGVKQAFNNAAIDYDAFSSLQKTVADRLLESFEFIKTQPETVLDLGAGTGRGSRQLNKQFKKAQIFQADLSIEMLRVSRKQSPRFFSKHHFICADGYELPLSNNSIDLVFSNLMLQWCNDPDKVFAEIKRVLKPGGVFVFSSFGPDTLKELRACWRQVDEAVHVNAFTDLHDIGDALIRNGMEAPVLSVEHIVVTYDECKQLMRDLKKIGAHNVNSGRRKTLTGKERLKKVIQFYESYRQDNKLPATYEVIYGHAWRSEIDKSIKNNANAQTISLDDLKQDLAKHRQKQ